jgi:hypothetical protein
MSGFQQQQQQQRRQPEHGMAASSGLDLPNDFVNDPAMYLTSIASEYPSRQGLASLAGAVARWFVSASPDGSAAADPGSPATQVAGLYLQAAAVQLRDRPSGGGGRVASRGSSADVEQEMIQTRCRYETLEAVGAAATLCPNRMAIASSGILPTLAQLMTAPPAPRTPFAAAAVAAPADVPGSFPTEALPALLFSPGDPPPPRPMTNAATTKMGSSTSYAPLQQAHVEFLQCALLAEQYRYAARMVEGTWPCPTSTVSVKAVLRYFYLRGLIHLGCQDYDQAHRCWWTCLSIPADICSTIMVQAWKKMVLVQPLFHRHRGTIVDAPTNYPISSSSRPGSAQKTGKARHSPVTTATTAGGGGTTNATSSSLPAAIPKCMTRLLVSAKDGHDHNILLYTRLGPAVEAGNPEVIQALIQSHEGLLKADGNYGLAQDCLRCAEEIQVWKDSQLFSVVPVAQLGQRWKVPLEQVPQRLIDSKLPCRIEEDGMVVFDTGAGECNNDSAAGASSSSSVWMDLSDWMQLLERMQQLDANISTSSKYQSIVRQEDKGGIGPGGGLTALAGAASLGPRGVEDF